MTETLREAELAQRNEHLERENTLLRQKIDALIRRLFGSQNEQLDPAQLQMLLQGVENEPTYGTILVDLNHAARRGSAAGSSR